jgi:hypothetical protein
MNNLLKLLFKINPKERPSCGEILKNPLIQKRIDFFTAQIGLDKDNIDKMDDNELLKTIRLSKDLIGLQEKLPKANYNLPNININNSNNANEDIKSNNIDILPNNTLPSIHAVKINNYNQNNNTNNFKININKFYLSKKTFVNDMKKIDKQNTINRHTNLYTSPDYRARQTKFEGRKNYIYSNSNSNTKKKLNIKSRKKILETYRLYVSNDSKRYLGFNKRNNLPKITIPKNNKSPKYIK